MKSDVSEVVLVLLSVIFVWLGYAFMYRRTRTDQLREDLFTMRDDLFDYMWQNHVNYDLRAYQQMRDMMNGAIRIADQLSFVPFAVLAFRMRNVQMKPQVSISISEIEERELREHFEQVYFNLGHRLWQHFFLEGPQWIIFKPIHVVRSQIRNRAPVADEVVSPMPNELARLGRRESPEARILSVYAVSH